MKSYVLEPVASLRAAHDALCELLPTEAQTWLLLNSPGDPVAYFSVTDSEGAPAVVADISGRHYDRDGDVLMVLSKLREKIGGEIIYSP